MYHSISGMFLLKFQDMLIYLCCIPASREDYVQFARVRKQSVIEEKVVECKRIKSKNSVAWQRDLKLIKMKRGSKHNLIPPHWIYPQNKLKIICQFYIC